MFLKSTKSSESKEDYCWSLRCFGNFNKMWILGFILALLWKVDFVYGYRDYGSTFTSLGFVIFIIFFIIIGVCVCIRFAKRRAAYNGQIIAPPQVTVYQPAHHQAHGPFVVQSHYQTQTISAAYPPHMGNINSAPYPPASTAEYPAQAWYPPEGPATDNFAQPPHPGHFSEPTNLERPPPSYEEVMGATPSSSSRNRRQQTGESVNK